MISYCFSDIEGWVDLHAPTYDNSFKCDGDCETVPNFPLVVKSTGVAVDVSIFIENKWDERGNCVQFKADAKHNPVKTKAEDKNCDTEEKSAVCYYDCIANGELDLANICDAYSFHSSCTRQLPLYSHVRL